MKGQPWRLLALLLIALYLFLPVVCLAHPCAQQEELADHAAVTLTPAATAGENPADEDPDCCETTCCCAGSLLFTPGSEPVALAATAKKSLFDPYLALPRLIDRIFVPPQNLS